jgi:hypothetical protein
MPQIGVVIAAQVDYRVTRFQKGYVQLFRIEYYAI